MASIKIVRGRIVVDTGKQLIGVTHLDLYHIWGDVNYSAIREIARRINYVLIYVNPVELSHRPQEEDRLSAIFDELPPAECKELIEDISHVTYLAAALNKINHFRSKETWLENINYLAAQTDNDEETTALLSLLPLDGNKKMPSFYDIILSRLVNTTQADPNQLSALDQSFFYFFMILIILFIAIAFWAYYKSQFS